jgi:phosphatidylinositol alpha-1,6-mannosyltransferase
MAGALGQVALSGAAGRKLRFIGLALRWALARPAPSDILCLHLRLSPVARLVTGARGRLAVFLQGIEAWKPLGALERWALERADVVVAISEHTAHRFLLANPGFSGRPIAVCHLGVGAAGAARSTTISARDVAGPFALIVGRLAGSERYKGHDALIDLWPGILDAVPGAHLVVAGGGDDRPRLEAKAAALGARVRFLGRVSDEALEALYRDCAFFVMPSRDEGFGLVFLEAMRARKACIGGAGAAAEVIEDGVTGLVVDATDMGEVEKAVVRLFLEPGTCARMGRAGAERVAREFTEAHFRRRFRTILGLPTP